MSTVTLSLDAHKQVFAERILPVVERQARFAFRHLRNRGDDLADAIADCAAHAWEGYVNALRSGKDPALFPYMLATYAVRRTKVGRRVGKAVKSRDVFNAAQTGRVELAYLDPGDCWHEALTDNRQTPVPDQAAFRVDFPAWLETLSERDRELAETLAQGHLAMEAADRFGLTRPRITQIRQQLMSDWEVFNA